MMTLEKIERIRREIEALRPGPVTVLAAYGDGSRRTLSLEQYLADDSADFISLHGGDVRAVVQVLTKYIGFETVIN